MAARLSQRVPHDSAVPLAPSSQMGRGFPTRSDYDSLCERYRPLLPSLSASALSPKAFVQALLHAIDLEEAHEGDNLASPEKVAHTGPDHACPPVPASPRLSHPAQGGATG